MTSTLEDILPTALDCRKIAADREAAKASDFMQRRSAADAEKKALLERLAKPSGALCMKARILLVPALFRVGAMSTMTRPANGWPMAA